MKLHRNTKSNIRLILGATAFAMLLASNAFGQDSNRSIQATKTSHHIGHTSESFADALQQSKRTGKPVMLVFSGSDWCGWCIKMSKNVFTTAEFANWESKNAIMMEVDFPQRTALPTKIANRNQMLKSNYGQYVQTYPTVLFLDSDGSVIAKTGYDGKDAASFINTANALIPQNTHNLAASRR